MRFYIHFLMIFLSFIYSNDLLASVVMTGTRVIYPSQTKVKTIQFTNPDKQPYIIQAQVESENNQVGSPGELAPFTVLPQIFRMEPGMGQSVRLKYSGDPLPQDRESLFYLSFTQLPALKFSDKDANQLVFAITNRVKIFYRPTGITGRSDDTANNLDLTLKEGNVEVSNSGGYYAVIRNAEIIVSGKKIILANSAMVPPKTKVIWKPSASIASLNGAKLRLTLVNDYGNDVMTERSL